MTDTDFIGTDAPETISFASQRLDLSCALWNEADTDKPRAILVHGALDQARSWDWTAHRLKERYRIAAPDLRGHGRSDWVSDGDYSIMDMVFDLASLIDHLEADKVTLIGHSLGGNIVLRYSGLYPTKIEKLASIEGLGPSPKMLAEREAEPPDERLRSWIDQRRVRSAKKPRRMTDIAVAAERMAAAHKKLTREQIDHLTRTGVKNNTDGSVSWAYDSGMIAQTASDIPHETFRLLISKITCPVWLAYGSESWASNPDKDGRVSYFDAKTSITVSEFDGAAHWLHHEQFDLFMTRLEAFLSNKPVS